MAIPQLVAAFFVSTIFLGISAIYDLCCRRVPNFLTGLAAIIGLSLPWVVVDEISLFSSYTGGILVLIIFMPPYALGLMGAGDVKALAVSGLFVGIENIFMLALYVAIAGGVLAFLYLFARSIAKMIGRKSTRSFTPSPIQLPYVVAIFSGCVYMLVTERLT